MSITAHAARSTAAFSALCTRQEKLLYDLAKKTAGLGPGFAMDGAGNLYGYTYFGGTYNGGTIYKPTLKK
jgi:uncharacterized repeat protein (TIGR03803 family)